MSIVGLGNYPISSYKSTDLGNTWANPWTESNSSEFRFVCSATDGKVICAGTDVGYHDTPPNAPTQAEIWRSADGGNTWTCVFVIPEDDTDRWGGMYWYTRSIATDGNGTWIAVAWDTAGYDDDTNEFSPYMAKSTDNGITWNFMPRTIDAIAGDEFCSVRYSSAGRWIGAMYRGNNPGHGLYMTYSDDAYATWTQLGTDYWDVIVCDFIEVTTDGTGNCYGVTQTDASFDSRMYVSFLYSFDNGASWTVAQTIHDESFGSGIACTADGVVCTCLTKWKVSTSDFYLSTIYRSTDYGMSWSIEYTQAWPRFGYYSNPVATDNDGTWIVRCTNSDNMFLSVDNGDTWVEVTTTPEDTYTFGGGGLMFISSCPLPEIHVGDDVIYA